MASEAYRIPFAPLDFSGIADAIRGGREHRRSMEYLAMERQAVKDRAERESKALARQEANDKYNREVAAFNAVPELQRRARQSPGQANINPFGIQFEQGQDLAPGVEGPEPSPAAEAARYMMNPQPEAPKPKAPTPEIPGALPYGVEGPSETPEGEAARFDKDAELERLMGAAQEDVPPVQDMMTRAATAAAGLSQPKNRLFMTYQGKRSEVPEQSDEATGFGPEYDALYNKMVELGEKPHDALKAVAGQYKSDQLQMSMSSRQGRQIDFRNQNREDTQAFQQGENEKYKLTFEQRKELANIMARAKMAAAGAGPVNPGLARLVGMKEAGATDEEIYAEAAKLHLPQKEVVQPVQNVVRNAAVAERAGEKRAGLEVTDIDGRVIGTAHNQTQANQLKKQTDQFAQARVRLKELIEDIEVNGPRIMKMNPTDMANAIQERLSKAESVNAAMRVYNGLGATDASQQLESRITGAIGTPGHGWLMGANLDVIKRILHEAELQHQTRVNTALRSGGGRPLAPALGGSRAGQVGGHPSEAPVGETRQGPDGRTYRKVGPNNWQPVTQ